MSIRRSWLVVALLALPYLASADSHKTEGYLGFSYANQSDLYGARLVIAKRFWGEEGSMHGVQRWNLVADAGFHAGQDAEREFAGMAGGRFTFAPHRTKQGCGGEALCTDRAAFVQALFGYTQTRKNGETTKGSGFAIGAGYDWLLWAGHSCGPRLQADWVLPVSGGGEDYPRVTLGIVVRKKHQHHD